MGGENIVHEAVATGQWPRLERSAENTELTELTDFDTEHTENLFALSYRSASTIWNWVIVPLGPAA
jgi:hypothetical protein